MCRFSFPICKKSLFCVDFTNLEANINTDLSVCLNEKHISFMCLCVCLSLYLYLLLSSMSVSSALNHPGFFETFLALESHNISHFVILSLITVIIK